MTVNIQGTMTFGILMMDLVLARTIKLTPAMMSNATKMFIKIPLTVTEVSDNPTLTQSISYGECAHPTHICKGIICNPDN